MITALYLVTPDIDILGVVDKYIYLILFYKPIQGFSGFMHSCMFLSTVYTSLGRSKFVIFCLSLRTFLGSVGEADAPPVCLLPRLARLASTHYCLFFTRCISKPWNFAFSGFSDVSDLDIHLRDPLLRVLTRLNVSNVIGGSSEVVRDSSADFLSLIIPARAAEVFFPS